MKKTIEALNKAQCSGCAGCVNSCPTNAIQMKEDEEGFLMPVIEQEKCVECGMCYERCPVLHTEYENNKKPQLYAVRASDEIRSVSSSGGMFTVLAELVLSHGGVVCGAAYDENMLLKHCIVDNKEDLSKLRGSKYVQSDVGYIYRDVKKYLEAEKEVLFTGTPCQVAALKKYLKKPYSQLLTVDLLCHGVPSQKSFSRYLNEKFPGEKVIDVKFRDKRFGWSAEYVVVVVVEGGKEYVETTNNNLYLKAFLRNLSLRNSCGDCPFCEFPRQGDITIGDFWGITGIDKTQTDGKGTSIVYVNSEKGASVFETIQRDLAFKEFSFSKTEIRNRTHRKYEFNANRDRFLKMLKRSDITFESAVDKALSPKYDIGVVSNYFAENFGGSLTQYALYHVLEDMGYSCLMIERPRNATVKASPEMMKRIYLESPYPARAMAEQKATKEQMKEFNQKCDCFVVGSDQLFQYQLYNDLGQFVTLDWVDNTKKKIAYAASYGHGRVWGEPKILAEMSFFMKMFDAFSVREKSGVEISKKSFGVEAEWVLDPVFLCDSAHYDALARKSKRVLPKKYIASYVLDPTSDRAEILRYAEKKLKMKAKIFSEFNRSEAYVKELKGLDVEQLLMEERLQLMKECDFFVTDSFHGTCLAIIMRKPFVAILNADRGGSRFESLLSMLGLENRLIRNVGEIYEREDLFAPIDFDAVHSILDKEKGRCMAWLQAAISKPKVNSYSAYDILVKKLDEQKKELTELRALVKKLQVSQNGVLPTIQEVVAYLAYLQSNKEKYIVVVSVKDTPGLALSPEVATEFRKLGFKTDLVDKHWHSYIGILNAGTVEYENLSSQPLEYSTSVEGVDIKVVSKSYNAGNLSINSINGFDYSVNRRGLNITVVEKQTLKVADSVCFDLHLKNYACYR